MHQLDLPSPDECAQLPCSQRNLQQKRQEPPGFKHGTGNDTETGMNENLDIQLANGFPQRTVFGQSHQWGHPVAVQVGQQVEQTTAGAVHIGIVMYEQNANRLGLHNARTRRVAVANRKNQALTHGPRRPTGRDGRSPGAPATSATEIRRWSKYSSGCAGMCRERAARSRHPVVGFRGIPQYDLHFRASWLTNGSHSSLKETFASVDLIASYDVRWLRSR